jgi:hypothetical protein
MTDKIEDYQLIDTKTSHLSVPELITTFLTTGAALQKHAFFGIDDNWPRWLEGATQYFSYADGLRVLDNEYRAGNKPKKGERDLLRGRSAFNYQLGGQYVTMRAYELKNPDLLLETFPLKVIPSKVSTSSGVPAYQVEIGLTAKNGPQGTAVLNGHHPPKGGPYQVQFCKGLPTSEDSWATLPENYLTCTKIVITNLDPVSQYYFRIRYNGPMGPGSWSQVVSLIIH